MQRTESAFLSTVFFVFISFKNTYCGQKHCTVCKNSLHCCKGKRQPYYLTVLLAFTSSKICFGNKKLLSLTKYVPLLRRSKSAFIINCFLCVFKFQKHVLWTKTLYRVQKFVTFLCVSMYDERRSLEKDVSVMQLLIPFFQTSTKKNACNFDLCPCFCNTHG